MKGAYEYLIAIIVILGLLLFMSKRTLNNKVNILNDSILVANNHIDSLYSILDGLPLGSPLDSVQIDDRFGVRKHPVLKIWRRHWGLDMKGTYRDTIYATGIGKIKKASSGLGYGNYVIIKHLGGYESLYAHMNKVFVKEGDKIKRGDSIGTVGSTGFSTGPHLHYEVIRNNKKTDPEKYLLWE
jgi:murein DD-endopeptidase MepM/ murein hydrolase activator NlpD